MLSLQFFKASFPGFSEMAASSSECGRQAAGLHAAAAEFGHAHQQRPDSADLYRQIASPLGHRNVSPSVGITLGLNLLNFGPEI